MGHNNPLDNHRTITLRMYAEPPGKKAYNSAKLLFGATWIGEEHK